MKEMIRYLRPYRTGLFMACLLIAISTACDLSLPTIMSSILNRGVYELDFSYILRCCGLMLAVSLVGLAAVLAGSWVSTRVVSGFCADLRQAIFEKVNRLTFEEFGKLGTAALVTRATHDVETVSWVAAELCGTVITIPVLFLGGIMLAMRKDVWLSLTLLAFVPVIVIFVIAIGRKIVPLWTISDEYIDKQNEIMRERLRGIRVIRAFNAEGKEHEKIADATRLMADYIIKCNVSIGVITPMATFLLNFATVLIVYLGACRIETGSSLTGGDIFAIVQYISLITGGVIMGAFTIVMFPHAKVAADRIGQVLHAQSMDDGGARRGRAFLGEIAFDGVTFAYQNAAEPTLRDITFHIAPGEKVSIIGGTGSGKSTIVNLLMGFRAPTAGRIFFDGRDAAKMDAREIRDNIGCVLQNTAVYSGTIRENVAMGRENAGDEEIRRALETAQAKEFVDSLADGMDHVISQSGKNLSGGQKQRLCIARAVLKNAPVYIFDDSFSALDFLTEANLRGALKAQTAGKTQIVITQRVTSAIQSDRIYVMDNGQIVGEGKHETLLETCPVYREIYASQIGGGISDEKEE